MHYDYCQKLPDFSYTYTKKQKTNSYFYTYISQFKLRKISLGNLPKSDRVPKQMTSCKTRFLHCCEKREMPNLHYSELCLVPKPTLYTQLMVRELLPDGTWRLLLHAYVANLTWTAGQVPWPSGNRAGMSFSSYRWRQVATSSMASIKALQKW